MTTEPTEPDIQNLEIPEQLPLLPVRDIVVFPYMVLPLFVGRDMSIKAIEAALAGNRMIFLATQKALDVESSTPDDIHNIGTIGIIMRMLKLPDERIKILVQGISKGRIQEYIQNEPYYSVRMVKIRKQISRNIVGGGSRHADGKGTARTYRRTRQSPHAGCHGGHRELG